MSKLDSSGSMPSKKDKKMRDPASEFYHGEDDEPHAIRRRIILKAHPEIKDLFKPDMRPVPLVVGMCALQWTLTYYSRHFSWPVFVAVAYCIGGTIGHSLSLMTHELSHNLVFSDRRTNEFFGIFCNMAMGIPTAVTFKRYHMEHHQYQGREGIDVDIPTFVEAQWFQSSFMKAIYLMLMPFVYAGRPLLIRPKHVTTMEIINWIAVIAVWCIVFKYCGLSGLLYMVWSFLMGHGLHPMAGHFIAEHWVFEEGHETYSYYGPLNLLAWNVGYHNEHHDFPRVPGWRLPQVRAIAPEFYDYLPTHKSWVWVMVRFIFEKDINPFSRMVRPAEKQSWGRAASSALEEKLSQIAERSSRNRSPTSSADIDAAAPDFGIEIADGVVSPTKKKLL